MSDHPVPNTACPCGRLSPQRKPLLYGACCGRYVGHFDTLPVPDAESLMRSRYSAFVLGQVDYLRATWHPSTCPEPLTLEEQARWLGLEVRGHWPDGERAEVEFVARYRVAGRAVRLHERSRFVRQTSPAGARWLYVDGEFLAK